MPSRKTTSRITKNEENTRPRSSRGVLRCIRVARATPMGAFAMPEMVAITMASGTDVVNAYAIPAMPMPTPVTTIQLPSDSL